MTNHRTIYAHTCLYCKKPYHTTNSHNRFHQACYMKHRRVTPSKQAYMILDFLNGLEEPIDCNDIAKYLKLQRGHTRKNLVRLEELGMVKKGFKITAKGIKTLRSKENE